MKRTLKAITAIVMILTLCLGLLTGCSGVTGVWTATSASAFGVNVDIPEEYQGMKIELKGDSTCTITVGNISSTEKWSQDGDSLTIGSYSAKLNDAKDTLMVDLYLCTINFKRK